MRPRQDKRGTMQFNNRHFIVINSTTDVSWLLCSVVDVWLSNSVLPSGGQTLLLRVASIYFWVTTLSTFSFQGLWLLLGVKRQWKNKLDGLCRSGPGNSIWLILPQQLPCDGNCVVFTVQTFSFQTGINTWKSNNRALWVKQNTNPTSAIYQISNCTWTRSKRIFLHSSALP